MTIFLTVQKSRWVAKAAPAAFQQCWKEIRAQSCAAADRVAKVLLSKLAVGLDRIEPYKPYLRWFFLSSYAEASRPRSVVHSVRQTSQSMKRLIHILATSGFILVCGLCEGFVTAPIRAQREHTKADPQAGFYAQSREKPSPPDQNGAPKSKQEARWTFVVAPLPISSPALGTGIVPVLGGIFPLRANDNVSPPSTVAVAGLATNNGSRGTILTGQLYFKENTYRATAAYARGNLNYNLFGLGEGASQPQLPLKQAGQMFLGEFLRRVGWNFFLGLRFFKGNSVITLRTSDLGAMRVPPDLGLLTSLTALGFRLYRDTRPNRFYPTTGTVTDFKSDFYAESLGSKYSFQSYEFTFSAYRSLATNQVLAYNLLMCATGGQPPFYGNCIYGARNQLRGYIAGRYLDRYMAATQLEYRLTLPRRFGLVGFGGLGEVIPGGNQPFRTSNFLPGVGGGLRFELSKKYHLNLRADVAQGRNSHTFGLGVGEAF